MKINNRRLQQTAWPVRLLAIGFLLAPLGNILISFAGSSNAKWYAPSTFVQMLGTIPWLDWLWLSLIFLSGVLLFVQHKTSWLAAVHSLVVVLGINLSRYFEPVGFSSAPGYVKAQLLISIMVTLAMLAVAFYFRFPYLDRRSGWFSWSEERFSLRTTVQVQADDFFEGITESLSLSGGFALLQRDAREFFANNSVFELVFLELNKIRVKCELVEYEGNRLRFRFVDLSESSKSILQERFQKLLAK